MKRLQDGWRTVWAIYADKTGVGDYIVEDMERGGLCNVTGVNFTDASARARLPRLRMGGLRRHPRGGLEDHLPPGLPDGREKP